MAITFFQTEENVYSIIAAMRTNEARRRTWGTTLRTVRTKGPTKIVSVGQMLAVAEKGVQTYPAFMGSHIVLVNTFETFNSEDIQGYIRTAAQLAQENRNTKTYQVANSENVGSTFYQGVANGVDVTSGDTMLILADIVKSALANNDTGALNSIQIINLGDATAGVWAAWLNYAGVVLETIELEFDATAEDVQEALLALDNVPSGAVITVTGNPGGPYTVEFSGTMGNRYISPLLISFLNLVGGDPEVTPIQIGTPVGVFEDYEVDAIVRVNGIEVPIASFEYNDPVGKLGKILNCKLAYPDVTMIPANASVDFSLVVTINGVATERKYIENGKLASRDYRMSFTNGPNGGPQDEVSFGAVDVIADRFTLAPRRPIIMYDPNIVAFEDVMVRPMDAIKNAAGRPIMPVYEHIAGLTMKLILQRAYTGQGGYGMMTTLGEGQAPSASVAPYISSPDVDQLGIGFDKVITNIPDYKLISGRADFDIQSSYHDSASPFVGMYDPQFLPQGNNLYVLSIELPLPFGSLPRVIPMSSATALTQTLPFKVDTNAVILTYQMNAKDDPDSDMFLVAEYEEDKTTSGKKNTKGYTETTTRTRYQRKKLFSTLEVVAEVIDEVVTETRTDLEGNGFLELTTRETINNTYYDDLKTGHIKRVEGLMKIMTAVGILDDGFPTILTETCQIFWVDDPVNPGQKIQSRSFTVVEGLIYERQETADVGGTTQYQRIPALVAQQSGVLIVDYNADAMGTLHTDTIETTEEVLRHIGGNQYDVQVTVIDCINGGAPKRSLTTPRTGDTNSNPYSVRSKSQLFTDPDSEAEIGPRVPMSINAGEVPKPQAIIIAKQALHRARNPLNTTELPLAFVDFGLDKGSTIIGQTRYAYTDVHIVAGLTIRGVNLKGQGRRINMSVNGLELPKQVA